MGTKEYMAPEILGQLPYDGIISDKFSLGQLLFTLVTGVLGFHSSNEDNQLYQLILHRHYVQYWNSPAFNNLNLSESFKNLFVRIVAFAPNERPRIEDILNDPWMQEINNLNIQQLNALENEVRNELLNRENQIQNNLHLQP